MATVKEMKDAIVEAVATLDESNGSRTGTAEAIDAAREILADAYGNEGDLNDAVNDHLGIDDADEDHDGIDSDGDGFDED